jgi:hypothetical protein
VPAMHAVEVADRERDRMPRWARQFPPDAQNAFARGGEDRASRYGTVRSGKPSILAQRAVNPTRIGRWSRSRSLQRTD